MINPIEHSRTKEEANKYKVEPYVVAADIYGGSLAGRGGWTWYTGSSSWMYEAGIKYILGLKIEGNILKLDPHIPANWNEYRIKIKYKNSVYNIRVVRRIENDKITNELTDKRNSYVCYKNLVKKILLNSNEGVYNIELKI